MSYEDERTIATANETSQANLRTAHAEPVGRPELSTGDPGNGLPATVQRPTLQYMLAAKRWLVWRAEPNPERPEKPKKIPYYLNGAKRGATDTPEDWKHLGTYDEACERLTSNDYSGLAFALGPDETGGCWQGIDLDEIPGNQLDQWAAVLPGYVEVSPSGKGLHAIGYGKHFSPLGPNDSGFEAYAHGRYFTVTGLTRKDEPLTCLAEVVEMKVAPLHSRPAGANTAGSVWVDPKTVTELRSALQALRSDDRELWVRMGHALCELRDVGRSLWIDWSQTSDKWKPADAKKWDTFRSERTGYRAVFAEAQRHGWVNPNSNAAQLEALQKECTADELFGDLSFDWDDTEPLPPDLVAGLIADEEVTLLGGHGGVGKGFLSLQIACAVAMGIEVLGHYAPQARRVLYYSAEDGRRRIGHRLRQLLESYTDEEKALIKQNLRVIDASDSDPLYGTNGPLPEYHKLRKMIEAFDPQLAIVDGASDTFDGNEIARREVRGFIKNLKRIHSKRPIGVLLIVHIDRASARGHTSNDDGYSGSAQWHNSCRRRMYLQRKVERDDDTEVGETILLRVMKNQDKEPVADMEVMRQSNGFWQPAIKFEGDLAQQKEDHAKTILSLIDEYYQREEFMSTSPAANAATGVFATLKDDPAFPRSLNWKKTTNIVRELWRAGELVAEQYKTTSRHTRERWRVLHDEQYELPGAQSAQSVT